MANLLKTNFNEFCSMNEKKTEDGGITHNFELFNDLKKKNGFSGEEIMF